MKAGKYTIKELFQNRYVDKILIPEIQRDYVWEKEQVEGLLDSLVNSYAEYCNTTKPNFDLDDSDLQNEVVEFIRKRNHSASIGFIYAYHDEETPGNYYLIDGQQRVTTIMLLLLSLASQDDILIEQFRASYLYGEYVKLDYKVRQTAHEFFKNFVSHVLKNKNSVTKQKWYYSFYDDDTTIQHILSNYKVINDYLSKHAVDKNLFYDYVCNYTEMWYFDTNISEQGEELYIYMNARGEQVQANENIKADLLSSLSTVEQKNKFGKIWEDWQDFFWKNKGGSNPNSDKGFNEFLVCISALSRYSSSDELFYSPAEFNAHSGVKIKDILAALDLRKIENYINALIYLLEKKDSFRSHYKYSKWVNDAVATIWKILNDKNGTNWYADYRDDNRGTERNRMIFIWGILYYLQNEDLENIDEIEVFRVIRNLYLRYNNYNRSVSTLKETINEFKVNGTICAIDNVVLDMDDTNKDVSHIRTAEELGRGVVLGNIENESERKELEEILWKIEDHPYNLNGRDVGGVNISHLLSLDSNTTKEFLEIVCDKFYQLFPIEVNNHLLIQNALMYYGRFWYRVTPLYYTNFKFDDWRKIIRNRKDDSDVVEIEAFRLFWKDFVGYGGSLANFYSNKKKDVIINNDINAISQMLLWYNQQLEDRMWEQGNYIAYSNGGYCALPDYLGKDKNFPDNYIFYNIHGNLKGGNPQKLSDLLQ